MTENQLLMMGILPENCCHCYSTSAENVNNNSGSEKMQAVVQWGI